MQNDFTVMQDITIKEKPFIEELQNLINTGQFDEINQFITDNKLTYKVQNAFNWNRLIKSISDKTDTSEATSDSLEGLWAYDFGNLKKKSETFRNMGEWQTFTGYDRYNLVKYQNSAYVCKQGHINQSPSNTYYWELAQVALPMSKIYDSELPTLINGDIFF